MSLLEEVGPRPIRMQLAPCHWGSHGRRQRDSLQTGLPTSSRPPMLLFNIAVKFLLNTICMHLIKCKLSFFRKASPYNYVVNQLVWLGGPKFRPPCTVFSLTTSCCQPPLSTPPSLAPSPTVAPSCPAPAAPGHCPTHATHPKPRTPSPPLSSFANVAHTEFESSTAVFNG
jgi:hypothetical protein